MQTGGRASRVPQECLPPCMLSLDAATNAHGSGAGGGSYSGPCAVYDPVERGHVSQASDPLSEIDSAARRLHLPFHSSISRKFLGSSPALMAPATRRVCGPQHASYKCGTRPSQESRAQEMGRTSPSVKLTHPYPMLGIRAQSTLAKSMPAHPARHPVRVAGAIPARGPTPVGTQHPAPRPAAGVPCHTKRGTGRGANGRYWRRLSLAPPGPERCSKRDARRRVTPQAKR